MFEKIKKQIIKKGTALAGQKGGQAKATSQQVEKSKQIIYTWRCRFRGAGSDTKESKEQCIRDTGLSRGTVFKYWDAIKPIHIIDPRYINAIYNVLEQGRDMWNDPDYDTECNKFDIYLQGISHALAIFKDWIASGEPFSPGAVYDGAQFIRIFLAQNYKAMPEIHRQFLRQLLDDYPSIIKLMKEQDFNIIYPPQWGKDFKEEVKK